MFKKGISVFTGLKDYSLEDNIKYLRLAKEKGYEIVFSSAHINEATTSYDDLQTLINEVDKLGMKLSIDISKPAFDKIVMPDNLYALRLDYGFSEEELIRFSNEASYKVEINASTYSKQRILSLIEKGLNPKNVRASFNYYPKLHTGHHINFVKEMTAFYQSLGITVGAFLPSHIGFRPPMYQGLPSVEAHRKMSTSLAVEEFKACNVDEILFGDAYASSEELDVLTNHQIDETIIEIDLFDNSVEDILNKVYRIRPDLNDELLRFSMSRKNESILPNNTKERHPMDVTIDNDGFLRYKGEINIVLKPLEQDDRVNVIGHLNTTDIIIESIIRGNRFILVRK